LKAWPLILGGAAALAAGAALAGARRRWRRAVRQDVAALAARSAAPETAAAAAEMPEPVRRYLEFASVAAAPPFLAARYKQRGEIALGPDNWKAFTAEAHYSARPRGFVWDARVAFLPLAGVLVLDSYVAGRGRSAASLAGFFRLGGRAGGGELAVASLQRYLAELPWLPAALLPAPDLHWAPLGPDRARASLNDGGVEATVDFHFGAQGEISGISAIRGRDVDGLLVPTPWEGRFADYREISGLRLPHRAEAAWILPDGRMPYWRAEILGCELARG
jgi:hypothetical protein